MRTALGVLLGVLAGFIMAGALLLVIRTPSGKPIELLPAPTNTPILVNIVGAVPRPGLYELPEGSRVHNAVDAAGGFLAEADASAINLAAVLEDGQQLDIPFQSGASFTPSPNTTPGATRITGQVTPSPGADDLLNINTATVDQLDNLPGIGPTTAQNIVDYRTEHGPFQRIQDLMNVPGVGPATFDRLKDMITV